MNTGKNAEKILLIGGGGHAKVVRDAIENSGEFSIYGITDPGLPKGSSVAGLEVMGSDEALPAIFRKGVKNAVISVASIGNCDIRKRIYGSLKNIGFKLPVIAHTKAVIAKDAMIGEGTFLAAGVVINPGVKIGKMAIINTSSSIDHDCEIGDFVHIAPGVTLSGGVKIGNETHVGTGANIIQNKTIGERRMIGAGRTIRHDE